MKIIKIFADYTSSDKIISSYVLMDELFFDENYNVTYRFTLEDDYTHAILINKAMPQLSIPKSNVIGLAHEPPEFLNLIPGENMDVKFIDYVTQYVGKYYIGEKYNLPEEFVERQGCIGHVSIPRNPMNKTKRMSLMISEKAILSGHIYRHQLVHLIIQNNLPVDIYGRGCKFYKPHFSLKGEFDGDELNKNYLFHISIENSQHPDYFSEKITNPLLHGTNVLYLGCSNIHKYFGETGIYLLTGNLMTDINLIINILKNWQKYYKLINVKNVSEVISIKNVIDSL